MTKAIEEITCIKKHQPIKLLKTKSYPTFQLYAVINNTKIDANTALRIAILETMSWLRKRFREIEIPEEIKFPEPQEYDLVGDDAFRSFRIDEGYIVDVVYIKASGTWSFHLLEPDLGPDPGNDIQRRNPVPGRVFETNIAYKINKDKQVECGFKTICSEPITSNAPCEVFRPAVVKAIVRNKLLGLKQIYPIIEKPHIINSSDKVKRLKDFIKDKDRQLPLIIIPKYATKVDVSAIQKELANKSFNYRNEFKKLDYMDNTIKLENNSEIPFEADDLIKYKMSFAQFAIISYDRIEEYNRIIGNGYSISAGDVRIIYPILHDIEGKLYKYKEIVNDKNNFIHKLEKHLEEYPKGKNIIYENVKFLNEARMQEQQQVIDMSISKEEIIKAIEDKYEFIQQQHNEEMNKKSLIIKEKEDKITRLQEDRKDLKVVDKAWEDKIQELQIKHSDEIEALAKEIKRKTQLLERPKRPDRIPEWINNHFSARLIFHQRAKALISKSKLEIDMDILCDSLEYLANEYYEKTFGLISEEKHNSICKTKYNRRFDVTPSGELSIRTYPKEYKIKYGIGPTGKSKEVPLDTHLKVGKGNENIIRIYFYIDKVKKLIVVGSLPEHLKVSSDK